MELSPEWARRLLYALPDNGLPFDKIDDYHRRFLHPEQKCFMWRSLTRQALRELVRQRKLTFKNGRYMLPSGSKVTMPRALRLPIDRFEMLYPEVSKGPWTA